MYFRELAMPKVNQDRRIIDNFSPAYDEYCTPYNRNNFTEETRNVIARNISVKMQPCKAIIIGDVGVGKTTIVSRFCCDKFQEKYKATIGVDFEVENFRVLGQCFNLQILLFEPRLEFGLLLIFCSDFPQASLRMAKSADTFRLDLFNYRFNAKILLILHSSLTSSKWDTAGQERFKCIAQAYYRNANIIVIVYDMTKLDSLHVTPTWLESALVVNNIKKPLIFLVGSKSDLLTRDEFDAMEKLGYEAARGLGAEYWSVSARTGFNIIELFQRIVSLSFETMMKQMIIETNNFEQTNEPSNGGFLQGVNRQFERSGDKDSYKGTCLC